MPETEHPAPPGAVPDIGHPFIHDGEPYAVRGWMCRTAQPGPPVGPDACALVFCLREDAEYVIPTGLTGLIVRVTDIETDVHANLLPLWRDSTVSAARTMAEHLNGQVVNPHTLKGHAMQQRRGTPNITFVNDGSAIEIHYRVITDHTATVPLDELPFDLDEVYAENDINPDGGDTHAMIEAIAEEVETDLEAIVGPDTELDRADATEYELTFTRAS